MTLEKIRQSGSRLFLYIKSKEENVGENTRIVEIRPSQHWCRKFPIIVEEELGEVLDYKGRKVIERIEVGEAGTLVLINNYAVQGSDRGAHRTEGPFLLVN